MQEILRHFVPQDDITVAEKCVAVGMHYTNSRVILREQKASRRLDDVTEESHPSKILGL